MGGGVMQGEGLSKDQINMLFKPKISNKGTVKCFMKMPKNVLINEIYIGTGSCAKKKCFQGMHYFNNQSPMFEWMKCQCKRLTVGEYNAIILKNQKSQEVVTSMP